MIVLIVEDNGVAGSSLSSTLRACGHRVEWAADGRSTLVKLEVMRPDVVLMDIALPDVNGIDLLRNLIGRVPRVIVLTGLPDSIPEEIAAANPGLEVLSKPVDVHELIGRLESGGY